MTVSVEPKPHTHRTLNKPVVRLIFFKGLVMQLWSDSILRFVVFTSQKNWFFIIWAQQTNIETFAFTSRRDSEKFLVDIGYDSTANRVLSFHLHEILAVNQEMTSDHFQIRVPVLKINNWLAICWAKLEWAAYFIDNMLGNNTTLYRLDLTLALKIGDNHAIGN